MVDCGSHCNLPLVSRVFSIKYSGWVYFCISLGSFRKCIPKCLMKLVHIVLDRFLLKRGKTKDLLILFLWINELFLKFVNFFENWWTFSVFVNFLENRWTFFENRLTHFKNRWSFFRFCEPFWKLMNFFQNWWTFFRFSELF